MGDAPRYAVTGGSGYFGNRLIAILRAQGRPVIALGRRRPAVDVPFLSFDLRDGVADIDALRQARIDVLVHAAYDFSVTAPALVHKVNVEGTARLLDAAGSAGIGRFIEISTMSAFDGCSSVYGQAKLAIERMVADRKGVSLRPGLIWGPRPGGMVGTLYKLTGTLPVVPLIGSGNALQYLVRDADVAGLIVRLGEPEVPYLTACHEQPLQFREILRRMAAAPGRQPIFVPVPAAVVRLMLLGVERVLPGRGLRADSVTGLIHGNPAPVFRPDVLGTLGVPPFQVFDPAVLAAEPELRREPAP
jgi:nucleoside-diphosphate-sugar epimerase